MDGSVLRTLPFRVCCGSDETATGRVPSNCKGSGLLLAAAVAPYELPRTPPTLVCFEQVRIQILNSSGNSDNSFDIG